MFGLTEEARLYPCLGQVAGKPVYAPEGMVVRCRTEPVTRRGRGRWGEAREGDTRIFTEHRYIYPGDRVVTEDGEALIVRQARALRGFSRVHHMEVLAGRED